MIRTLRRSRLLALVLLLATPALGGAWLQAAHPCPVDAPWVLDQGAGHGDHGEHSAPAGCQCVGSCAGAAATHLPPVAVVPAAVLPAPAVPPRLAAHDLAPAFRPSHRLPPATAPPLA